METYHGHVRTPQDAIILFEACRLGLLPRVQRRLSEKERSQIKSGSVFVWDEREAGMRRWTDGKSWSASRVSGSFLTYREMEGKRSSNAFPPGAAARSKSNGPKSATGSDAGGSDEGEEGPDGYRYKPDGLMKQSFSITNADKDHLHLISYYNRSHMPPLKTPSTDPQLRNITAPKEMYPETADNNSPGMAAMGRPPMPAAPYPGHHPPGVVIAYPWYPGGYAAPPPGTIAYHAPAWPPSPSATPPLHYAYPHPAYAASPYGQPQLPPFPHGPPTHASPAPPQAGLPHPHLVPNGHTPPGGWPPARSPGVAGYTQPGATPYASTQPPTSSASTTLAPVTSSFQQKPPSPPASANTASAKPFSEPPPLKDIPASSDGSAAAKIIPSITALINGPLEAREAAGNQRSGSKSPNSRVIKDVPNAMTATVERRDKGDLKKLDSQLLKSRS